MNKGGILIDRIGLSQIGIYLCNALNTIEEKYLMDIIVFYSQWDRAPLITKFCMLQQFEAWGFDASVIATDLKTAELLIKCPCPPKKYFYVWDLEWIYGSPTPYNLLKNIYQHDELELIARSQYHYDIISKCWKKPIDILEDFDYEKLVTIFKR